MKPTTIAFSLILAAGVIVGALSGCSNPHPSGSQVTLKMNGRPATVRCRIAFQDLWKVRYADDFGVIHEIVVAGGEIE